MKPIISSICLAGCLLLGACADNDTEIPADALVTIGNKSLTRSELSVHIRPGLSAADSTELARAFIRSWIDAQLVAEVASAEVDMDEVERLTAEYRNELIKAQYRRVMASQASPGIFAEDPLMAYYNSHLSDFVLERPMLKGIYIKVPDQARELPSLRRLYKSDRPDDIDKLEKAALSAAVHYDYFRDRWVDSEQIDKRIPIDFDGADGAKIAARKPIEISSGGFTYLLSVSDYLAAGATMPYEAARPLVRERLLAARRIAYDATLRNALFSRAIEEGTIRFNGPNPLK